MTFIKRRQSIYPVDPQSEKFVKSLSEGELIGVTVKAGRNYQHHCKLWAIAEKVAQNSDNETSRTVLDKCMIRAGLIDSRIVDGDNVYIKVKSLSYSNMNRDQFEEAYNLIIEQASIMSGISRYDLEDNWQEYFKGCGD